MQLQEPRIARLLDKLQLARFQLKEYRNIDDCEYRTPGYNTKHMGKTLEIIYQHNFNLDLLITHLEIQFHRSDVFSELFQLGEIESSSVTSRGSFSTVIRSNSLKTPSQHNNLIVPCVCITQCIRISMLLKRQFFVLFNDSLNLKRQKNKQTCQQNVSKMIHNVIKAVNICGYQLSMNTSASELVTLLNISQAFKYSKRFDQAAETDILASLSLISARRFVQASELLRKVSKFYVEKYISSKSSMDFSRIDKTWIKEQNRDQFQISGYTRSFCSGRVLEGGRYLYKAAKIELLLAQTINQPNLLGEKLDAYNKANSYANGNINPTKIDVRIDYEQACYSIGPSIIPFLLKVLTDKSDMLKISSLKSIQFFYQTLGCTLGNYMAQILKTLIAIYPSSKDKEEGVLKTEQNLVQRSQTSTRIKLILDHINHLLESLFSLIPGMNKKYLKVIFEQIILVSISQQYRNQLRLYILRFGQRIMQICGPDLQMTVNYIKYIFIICQGKYTVKTDINKHINHNLVYFSQRVIDLLKTKVLKNYNKIQCLTPISSWIHQTLINLCDNESTTASSLNHILDLIVVIYSNPKVPNLNPIEPIIYLLNSSLNQPKLPFDKILDAFIILIKFNTSNQGGELGCEIIERVMAKAKLSTLSLKELKILQKVLDVTNEIKPEWLQQFLECIPHSNFDQIYVVFDRLIVKCAKKLNKNLIYLIINTLFNQYTVKGKAHQKSKELFIITIVTQLPSSFYILLELCLFDNKQPNIQDFQSKKRLECEHAFDSKLYKVHSELFAEKISLLLLVFAKEELILTKFVEQFTNQNLVKLWISFKRILLSSTNFKIKSKMLILMKQMIVLLDSFPKINEKSITKQKLLFIKINFEIIRSFISTYRDTKLHYYAILNLGLILNHINKQTHQQHQPSCLPDFMDQQIGKNFKIPNQGLIDFQTIIRYEMLKMWQSMIYLCNSPWQNVREIAIQVFFRSFKFGLSNIQINIRNKLQDQLFPFIKTTLSSSDYIERLLGIKLLALCLGFGRQYPNNTDLKKQIESNVVYFRQLMEIVIILQEDWNQEISNCSKLIAQVCITRQYKQVLLKRLKSDRKYSSFLDNSILSFNLEDQIIVDKKQQSFDMLHSFQKILKVDDQFNIEDTIQMPDLKPQTINKITHFRQQIQNINFNNLDNVLDRDSFMQEEQHFFDPNDQRHSEKQVSNRSQEEQLQFEDLGIIELDDEEWGEQQNEVRITQKLPLKKIYKLSPNLGSSSKHHRLHNKRLHHSQYQQDKIIVDQLEGKINIPIHQHPPPSQLRAPEKYPNIQQIPIFDEKEGGKFDSQRHNSLSQQLIVTQIKSTKKQKEKEKQKPKKRKASTTK